MEMVYAALLLHSVGKPVDEDGVKKIITAAGGKADDSQVKALVSNLKDVNIDEAIKQTAVASAPQAVEEKKEEKPAKDEKKEEEKAEEAAAGLGSLFG